MALEEIIRNRKEKIALLKQEGLSPYPIESRQDYTLEEASSNFNKLSKSKKMIALVGRVFLMRPQGAIIFFTFDDGTGKFQGLIKKGEIEDRLFNLFLNVVDVGDFLQVEGFLILSKRGEKTIKIKKWKMLSKSLRPLPEKWHGLQDVDDRFRKRYLDVLMNPDVKNRFIVRSRLISEIRKIFDKKNFLEVETPILQPLAGGASAEPFVTRHNALDIDMYLRIAPELYLKMLLVAGFHKVYEIGKLFRNEGIDVTHNPEFTTIEFYESYANAKTHRVFIERILKTIVKKISGKSGVEFDGNVIDFSKKFAVISFHDLLKKYTLISNLEFITDNELKLLAERLGVRVVPGDMPHKIFDNIYKKAIRQKLIQPTFIVDYPEAFSPLAKKKEDHPEFIDRFQLVIGGYELVNAFSELNDPEEQRNRFIQQEKNKKLGDSEAQPNDKEYVEAMEYGMPPAAGAAISIDRLVMLLTNTKNIREVILFPTLRPKTQ